MKKYDTVVKENSALKVELEEVKQRYLQDKHRWKVSGNPFEVHSSGGNQNQSGNLHNFTSQDRDQLQQQRERDQLELKRLSTDNEKLVSEREVLIDRLQRADHEKKELTTNFSFVKSQYDKLQVRASQGGSGSGGDDLANNPYGNSSSSSSQQLQSPYPTGVMDSIEYKSLLDERNRYASQVGQLLAELEKNKSTDNSTLEKVMTSNAKILEEKDKLQGELSRVSRLYSEAVRAATSSSNGSMASTSTGGNSNQVLHQELIQKDARISELELENNGLRARIRKLASVG